MNTITTYLSLYYFILALSLILTLSLSLFHSLSLSSPPSPPSLLLSGMLSKAKAQQAEPLALLMVGSMERGEYCMALARCIC
jgi:hypothetical protein